MPDVAHSSVVSEEASQLDWVGMNAIVHPITFLDDGVLRNVEASNNIFVNLLSEVTRGVHMSRLYLGLQEVLTHQVIKPSSLVTVLKDLLATHADLSSSIRWQSSFDCLLYRPALLSTYGGWRTYPVEWLFTLVDGVLLFQMTFSVTYASTCPCSAALSRQLNQKAFQEAFGHQEQITTKEVEEWLGEERSLAGVPHSQRSRATVCVTLSPELDSFPLTSLIGLVEDTLGTSVQTAVKRQDEQEFARLGAKNLMFCEDACRRIKRALMPQCDKFHLKVEHFESLHEHDAVSMTSHG